MSIPLMFWSFVFYVALQVIAIKKLKGRWLTAAKIPVPLMAIIIFVTILGAIQGSNLFPIFLLFSGPFLLLYICVLFASYWASQYVKNRSGLSP